MQVESADRSQVVSALRNAAAATGSDFHYLLGTAMRESSLKPDAQSPTSSAAGLFQFVDQTWLGLVKEHGAQHGLGDFADAISRDANGRYHADGAVRQSILALRKDPQTSALMAGEYARTTQSTMRASLGRDVCGGELYAAHFLGADSACKLIRMAGSDPGASAAAQFPQAASANRNVFYHADGTAKSVREIYDWALRQPGDTGLAPIPVTSASLPALASARVSVANAQDSEVQMLLSSVMNWQPGGGHSLFGNLFGLDGKPQASALSFSPGLLGLLSDAKDNS